MELRQISNRANPLVKRVVKLRRDAAQRRQEGLFFAEGRRLCRDLAETHVPHTVFVTAAYLAAEPGCPLLRAENLVQVTGTVMEKLCETPAPQGVACLFRLPPVAGLLPQALAKGALLCEDIQDPANLGGLIRSAAGLGFGLVALSPSGADPYSPKALRASMGAVGRVALVYGREFIPLLRELKAAGVHLYAAALQGAVPLAEWAPKAPFGLLVGNEGRGLSEEALALAGQGVFLPMANGVESFNAGVAGALLMYHAKHFAGEI